MSNLKLQVRRSEERGTSNLGWLNSKFSFSFANYYDPGFTSFGALRVINDDRIKGGQGFPEHPHKNAEIFTYVITGALKHDDSMAHSEIIPRGSVQFTSAGTGMSHSEYNADSKKLVTLLQCWVMPERMNLRPTYSTRSWTDAEKTNQLLRIISPKSEKTPSETIKINAQMSVYASILQTGQTVKHTIAKGRQAYLHIVTNASGFDTEDRKSKLRVNETDLKDGDGLFIRLDSTSKDGFLEITSTGSQDAEFLLFDMTSGNNSSRDVDSD